MNKTNKSTSFFSLPLDFFCSNFDFLILTGRVSVNRQGRSVSVFVKTNGFVNQESDLYVAPMLLADWDTNRGAWFWMAWRCIPINSICMKIMQSQALALYNMLPSNRQRLGYHPQIFYCQLSSSWFVPSQIWSISDAIDYVRNCHHLKTYMLHLSTFLVYKYMYFFTLVGLFLR
jgi:hypothetical protein